MGKPKFRCRARSADLHESLHGTASTVRGWVLIEESGPWGADALRDSRLDPELTNRIRQAARSLRLRIVLIRRVRRRTTQARPARQCLLAWTGPGECWVEATLLEDLAQVLYLDLERLSRGRSPGLRKLSHPLYLVCTQGGHDPCCAERGRPLAQALEASLPEQTWEVSHIGGDRFAANLLVLPQGLYYGRVPPEAAVPLAQAHARGEVDPRFLRGRTSYSFSVQAAECLLRTRTGIRGIDDLPLLWSRRDGNDTEAMFGEPRGGSYRVRVRTVPAPTSRRLTCHANDVSTPPEHQLVELRHETRRS